MLSISIYPSPPWVGYDTRSISKLTKVNEFSLPYYLCIIKEQ